MPSFKTITTLLALALTATAAVTRSKPLNTGSMTYYEPGLGACGGTNSAGDNIVAVSSALYDSADRCSKGVAVTYEGKTVQAVVVDRCPGCQTDDLDVSPAVFKALTGGTDAGRVTVSWNWA